MSRFGGLHAGTTSVQNGGGSTPAAVCPQL